MIICLGNIPATLILGNNKYSLSSNEVLETIYGVSGIATYHPAYIMRLRSSYESDEEEFRVVMDSFLRSIEVAKDYIGDLQ
jgi:uracil-DNA glycosylase